MARIDYVEASLWERPIYLIGPAQLRFEGHGRVAGHASELAHAMVIEAVGEAARRIKPAWHIEEATTDDAAAIAEFRAKFPGIDIPRHWLDYRADLHISPVLRDLRDTQERAAVVHLLAAALAEPSLRVRSLPLLNWALRPDIEAVPAMAGVYAQSLAQIQEDLDRLRALRAIYLPHLKPYLEGSHWVHHRGAFTAFHTIDDLALVVLLEVGNGRHLSPLDPFGVHVWPTVRALAASGWCTIRSCSCAIYGAGQDHDIAVPATMLRRVNRDEQRIYLER
jgi:hypothetical protein